VGETEGTQFFGKDVGMHNKLGHSSSLLAEAHERLRHVSRHSVTGNSHGTLLDLDHDINSFRVVVVDLDVMIVDSGFRRCYSCHPIRQLVARGFAAHKRSSKLRAQSLQSIELGQAEERNEISSTDQMR
jgi:hypothetical protein